MSEEIAIVASEPGSIMTHTIASHRVTCHPIPVHECYDGGRWKITTAVIAISGKLTAAPWNFQ